jgi:AcrR family transcriptional regulator
MAAPVPDRSITGRRYRGQTPPERRAARRRRLLDVGLKSFGTVGYAATTIEQLCADSGVTPRHFYEEFPSREALLTAVFDEVVAVTVDALAAALSTAPLDLRARIRTGVGSFVHALCDDPRRARVLCVEAVGVSPDLEGHRREVTHAFTDMTEREAALLAERSGNADRSVHYRSLALVGATKELVIEWVLGGDQPPLEQLIDELTAIWIAVGEHI